MLVDWKQLPAYKLEPRIDSLVGYYLPDILNDFLGEKIVGIIPELPLRKGTLYSSSRLLSQAVKRSMDKLSDLRCRTLSFIHLPLARKDQDMVAAEELAHSINEWIEDNPGCLDNVYLVDLKNEFAAKI